MDLLFYFLVDNINSYNSYIIVSIYNILKKFFIVICRLDIDDWLDLDDVVIYVKYWMIFFVFFVFLVLDFLLKVIW